jgi:hypothetical protein
VDEEAGVGDGSGRTQYIPFVADQHSYTDSYTDSTLVLRGDAQEARGNAVRVR